jgi:hypothetical protein
MSGGVDMSHKVSFFTAGTLAVVAFSALAGCASVTQGTMPADLRRLQTAPVGLAIT